MERPTPISVQYSEGCTYGAWCITGEWEGVGGENCTVWPDAHIAQIRTYLTRNILYSYRLGGGGGGRAMDD
jgi:hypothetical protein